MVIVWRPTHFGRETDTVVHAIDPVQTAHLLFKDVWVKTFCNRLGLAYETRERSAEDVTCEARQVGLVRFILEESWLE